MSDPFTRFDRDPDALAWARSKVRTEVDRARMLGEEAAAVHDPEQSEVWHRLANRMQRVLVDGTGCVHGAFDERLPELVAEIDTLRAAEPTAPAEQHRVPTLDRSSSDWPWVALASDLDRCEHGRHEGDDCGDCDGPSHGNPHMRPGAVIGYGLHADPIVMPTRTTKHDPAAWRGMSTEEPKA